PIPPTMRLPLSSSVASSRSLLPRVVARMTISLVKSTSGTLSASFHDFQRFSNPLAVVMQTGASFARFSSSAEPVHSLMDFTGVFWAHPSEANVATAAIAARATNPLSRAIVQSSLQKRGAQDPLLLLHFPYRQRHLVRLSLGEDLTQTFRVGTLADVR